MQHGEKIIAWQFSDFFKHLLINRWLKWNGNPSIFFLLIAQKRKLEDEENCQLVFSLIADGNQQKKRYSIQLNLLSRWKVQFIYSLPRSTSTNLINCNKCYLFSPLINQNNLKTASTRSEIKYFFAATASMNQSKLQRMNCCLENFYLNF